MDSESKFYLFALTLTLGLSGTIGGCCIVESNNSREIHDIMSSRGYEEQVLNEPREYSAVKVWRKAE